MELSRLKNSKKTVLGKLLIISIVMGLLAFSPIWIHFKGQLMDYGDYFAQYVAFIKEMKRMLISGSFAWSWNSFLGDGFISAYSYYTVFNPFAWFVLIFPDKYILYGTMVATLLKLGVATVSSYLFIKQFTKRDVTAELCAIVYAFSSFSCINTNFYFFLDIVAVFPFVLYGLERLLRENKKWIYIIALTVNASMNYYFYVATVFIVIIYVFFRLELYYLKNWKINNRKIFVLLFCSILGTGIACFALVPSFFAMLGSGKATQNIGKSILLFYYPQNFLEHLKALLVPAESNRYHAFFDASTWSSTACYLPVFGLLGYLMLWEQKGNWLRRMCSFFIICFFVPVLNSMFMLFSSDTNTRWLYALALFLSLSSAVTIENLQTDKIKHKKVFFIVAASFTALLLLVPSSVYFLQLKGISLINRFCSASVSEYFMGYKAIVVILLLTMINYGGLGYYIFSKHQNLNRFSFFVVIMCVLNFGVYNYMNYDRNFSNYRNDYYYKVALIDGEESDQSEYSYRIDYPSPLLNYGLFKNMPSVNYYNSVQNKSSSEFAAAVGISDSTQGIMLQTSVDSGLYTDALLSVQYFYDYDKSSDVPSGFVYESTNNNVDIYRNTNYIPMGFSYDNYVLQSEIETLSTSQKAALMLHSLIIDDDDENEISNLLIHGNFEDADFRKDVSDRQATANGTFIGTSKGFKYKFTTKNEELMFFSIPYDSSWSITVNGSPAKIYKVNYGLVAIKCGAGTNVIKGVYNIKGENLGILISILCLIISAIFIMISNKNGNHLYNKDLCKGKLY